jgi:hypothetical protein
MRTRIALAALTALTVGVLVGIPVVQAKEGDVIKTGSCSARSDWKLKLGPDNNRIEVEFQVDQNKAGQDWKVRVLHDGTVVHRETATTGGASGSFTIRLREPDNAGTDSFVAKARNLSTDEACKGSASF